MRFIALFLIFAVVATPCFCSDVAFDIDTIISKPVFGRPNVTTNGTGHNIDMVFAMDITGSMGPYLQAMLDGIRDIIRILRESRDGNQAAIGRVRLAFVGYRDIPDRGHFQILPFTTDVRAFERFLRTLRATGGGDREEDVFGALQKVAGRQWAGGRTKRVLLHIADQPCHHHRCRRGSSPDPLGRDGPLVLRPLKALPLSYNFGRIKSSTDSMVRYFQETLPIRQFDMSASAPPPGSDSDTAAILAKYGVADGVSRIVEKDGEKSGYIAEAAFGSILKAIDEE